MSIKEDAFQVSELETPMRNAVGRAINNMDNAEQRKTCVKYQIEAHDSWAGRAVVLRNLPISMNYAQVLDFLEEIGGERAIANCVRDNVAAMLPRLKVAIARKVCKIYSLDGADKKAVVIQRLQTLASRMDDNEILGFYQNLIQA